MDKQYNIESAAALAEIIGAPQPFVGEKVRPALDDAMTDFIGNAPLLFFATVDSSGHSDVSPKGDPAGFVQIDSQGRLCIPERPGNKLTFGFHNILRDPRVGLLFVVPGLRETLRVKGTASLHRDPAVLAHMAVNGKPALLYTRVQVSACFFHCGKAMIRSKLWQADRWQPQQGSPMARQLAHALAQDPALESVIAEALEQDYSQQLY